MPYPSVLVVCEKQSASSRIWTRVAVSISNDDNHYTIGTQLYGFKYSYLEPIIFKHLFDSKMGI